MNRPDADSIVIEDITRQATLASWAADVPQVESLGFRRLGVARVTEGQPHAPEVVETARGGRAADYVQEGRAFHVWVSRYGDALAHADLDDPDVVLRLVTILTDGGMVVTRVVEPGRSGVLADRPSALRQRWEEVLPNLSGFLRSLEHDTPASRYRSLPSAGLVHQVIDVDDAETLWLTHRGLVRRHAHTGAADHNRMAMLLAIYLRLGDLEQRVAVAERGRGRRLVAVGRNVLLALPVILLLIAGMTLWMAVLLVGCTSGLALVARAAVEDEERRWMALLTLPLLVALGWMTIGVATVLALFVVALGVVFAHDLAVMAWPHRLAPLAGDPLRGERPIPPDELLEMVLG